MAVPANTLIAQIVSPLGDYSASYPLTSYRNRGYGLFGLRREDESLRIHTYGESVDTHTFTSPRSQRLYHAYDAGSQVLPGLQEAPAERFDKMLEQDAGKRGRC